MEDKGIIRHINMEQKKRCKGSRPGYNRRGPAGLAVAVEAWKHGVKDILILEQKLSLEGYFSNVYIPDLGLRYLVKN